MDLLPYFTNTQSGITNKKEEKYGTIKEKRKLKYVVSVVLGGANLKLSGRFVKRHRKGLVHESDTPPPPKCLSCEIWRFGLLRRHTHFTAWIWAQLEPIYSKKGTCSINVFFTSIKFDKSCTRAYAQSKIPTSLRFSDFLFSFIRPFSFFFSYLFARLVSSSRTPENSRRRIFSLIIFFSIHTIQINLIDIKHLSIYFSEKIHFQKPHQIIQNL